MVKTAPTARAGPHRGMLECLAQHDVDHELHEHHATFSAQAAAREEGVDPRTFAKVVGVATNGGQKALLVVDASDHVSLAKARKALSADEVRLLTEAELQALAPACEVGALPALGVLFDLPMFADLAVRDDREISFNAGSHRFSVRVDRAGWEIASGVLYADLAQESDTRPAWAGS